MDEIVPESDLSDANDPDQPEVTKAMTSDQPRKRQRCDLVHSREWFRQSHAGALWMPDTTEGVPKPCRRRKQKTRCARGRRRKKRKRRQRGVFPKRVSRFTSERAPAHMRSMEPLLTSWFDVSDFAEEEQKPTWRSLATHVDQPTPSVSESNIAEEDDVSVNSVVKLRLFPTTDRRKKLELMFAANRAVYNKLVACSREDRLGTSIKKMSQRDLMMKYRPIAVLKSMSKYFRNNKRARARHKLVHDEVRDSAFRDFKKVVKSSLALFFAKKKRDEKTTYPDMKFKSKFALSNTIEIRARSIKTVQRNGQDQIRFHQTFFGLKPDEGIALHEPLPVLTMSVRLQRLRDGEYYDIVPHLREFSQTKSERVCAIDPGVRKFVTVYDPAGRTFGVKDAHRVLKKKFEAVDTMKSILQLKQNACKEMHRVNVRSKHKHGSGSPKSSEYRLRYRLRQRIRHTSRKATRVVNDMHQKLSSWLATNYSSVLLPSFQTSEMVRRYFLEVASDATPEPPITIKKRKIKRPTARAMLALAHYRFKLLLKYKMKRSGGRLIECEEEYTSKTCSSCGVIKSNLGGSEVFRCGNCFAVYDRDVNAARHIFHKNKKMLA